MIKKLMRDLTQRAPVLHMDDARELTYYYFKFQHDPAKLNRLIHSFDDDGVPLNSTYIDVDSDELFYYPISIGQFALGIFHKYLSESNEEDRAHFLRIADWFVSNAVNDDRLGAYWLTAVPKPEFNVYEPWKSAFVQSRALSVLLRAYQLTDDISYYDLAVRALETYRYSIVEGGVRAGGISDCIYEEYVANKPTRILDGAIFSLFGLYDMVRAAKDESAEKALAVELFEQGVDGLLLWLPKYDMGYWVYYCRCEIDGYPSNDPCTIGYLRLVCAQLKMMSAISGRNEFQKWASQFSSYLKPLNILRMYREKYKALRKLNRL